MGKLDKPDEALEQLLADNLTILEGFLRAFSDASFDDIVSIIVDGKPAYVDVDETVGDLQQALEKTAQCGALDEGFSVLRVTFSRVESGLRVLGELRANARVEEGEAEARIRISARPDDVDLRDAEGPKEYAARIREYMRNDAQVQAHVAKVQSRVDSLVDSIPSRLPGSKVLRGSSVAIRVVACGPRQVGRLRHLGFREARRHSRYSALPNYEQIGAYDDPLTHHYFSPYQDLFDWIAVGEVLAGRWSSPIVRVVHPSGRLLFRGDQGAGVDPASLEVARNAIRVNADGELVVDATIPYVEALQIDDAESPHRAGWGGEEWTEDLDDGG